MMRARFIVLSALALADVGPRCGERRHIVAGPWQACGGPAECTGGTQCVTLDRAIDLGNARTSYVCSHACATDAECATMGTGFTCSGKGTIRGAFSSSVVCAR
jgi:hypothetical protein